MLNAQYGAKLIAVAMTLSSLLLSGSVQAGQSPPASKFKSEEGAFAVKMPGKPEQSTTNVNSSLGPTTLHIFQVEGEGGKYFYMVGYSIYSTTLDTAASLEGVINGQLKNLGGKIISDKTTSLNGHPGRSVQIEANGTIFVSSVYVVGNRLYQVMFGMPKGETLPAGGKEFFDSFEILM